MKKTFEEAWRDVIGSAHLDYPGWEPSGWLTKITKDAYEGHRTFESVAKEIVEFHKNKNA